MVTPGMSDPTVTGSGALSPAHRARQPDDLAGHETPGFASPPRDGFALIWGWWLGLALHRAAGGATPVP